MNSPTLGELIVTFIWFAFVIVAVIFIWLFITYMIDTYPIAFFSTLAVVAAVIVSGCVWGYRKEQARRVREREEIIARLMEK